VRLFLCDDNAQYRQLARLALEQAGHEIAGEAGNGEEALDRAPAAAADVVLLDLNMPVMNGLEALPHLRATVPSARIVVLTTGQRADERRRALAVGADAVIVKPERIFTLADELSTALAALG
jgi:DNA-binding NarL/FixJ family response regulator